MLFLNAAHESEIHTMQVKVARERADRIILLNKLLSYEKKNNKESISNKSSQLINNKVDNPFNISSIEESNKILSSMLSRKSSLPTVSSGKVPPVPTLSSLTNSNSTSVSKKKKTISSTVKLSS